jgi:hypothetical protein
MRYSYDKLKEIYSRKECYSPRRIDIDNYPGTSFPRMVAIQKIVKNLSKEQLNGPWNEVRKTLISSGGLRDLPITRHSFNDYNHCDLVAMNSIMYDKKNEGRVKSIAYSNDLGDVIREASLPELGPGGSWTTCMIGSGKNPPQDVAHIQFKSKIAFKLIWIPDNYDTFVLVDDDGNILARGSPTGELPSISERKANYNIVKDSKYVKNI